MTTTHSDLSTAPVGQSDLVGTRLIYGCMRIVGGWDPSQITPQKKEEAKAAVRAALEAGYSHFDHADIYCLGECERVFGELLREQPDVRDRIIITTKCGIRFAGQPNKTDPRRYDHSPEHIVKSCEGSLKRLGIETIDIYLLHHPDELADIDQIAQAFDQLRKQGKVRHFGVSNYSVSQLQCLQAALDQPLVCNQLQLHPARRDYFEDNTLHEHRRLGVTPTGYSPVAGGMLATGGTVKPDHPDRERLQKLLDTLDAEAEAYGVDRTAITLAWLLRHPAGIQPIIGTRQPERIRAMAAADRIQLSRESWYRIEWAARGLQ